MLLANDRIEAICVVGDATLLEVLKVQCEAKQFGLPAGIALVVDNEGRLCGTVTDGDVRRAVLRTGGLAVTASEAMSHDPILFPANFTAGQILELLPVELEKRGRSSRLFLGKIVLVDDERRPVRVMEYHHLWEQRVATHRHLVVVGLGYVGLTLALVMADESYRVTGVDIDRERVAQLARGESYVHELGLPQLLREHLGTNLRVSTEIPADGDVFIVSVGTPVEKGNDGPPTPDLRFLREACELIAPKLRFGSLVVLRSTVPVGTTRSVVLPLLERLSGLRGGLDFHLSFAPERTIEGKALHELRNLPQIIGGLDADSVEATVALFRELTPTVVRVASLESAEMVKLINNSFRDLVFSFANEMARVASAFDVDVVEVIGAANRGYPRDPVPLPSPGVGGPCLTKDPYILAAAGRRAGLEVTLSERGRRINEAMHAFVADALLAKLEALGKDPAASRVLVCGLAFKGHPETGDMRDSSSIRIAELLSGRVGKLYGHDPVVAAADIARQGLEPVELPTGFAGMDAVLFLNNHRRYETLDVFEMVRGLNPPGIVFDGWRLFEPDDVLGACPCVYMGLSFSRSSVGVAAT